MLGENKPQVVYASSLDLEMEREGSCRELKSRLQVVGTSRRHFDPHVARHRQPLKLQGLPTRPLLGPLLGCFFTDVYRFLRLYWETSTIKNYHSQDSRALWEWKNRVLLKEYYIFNVVIPLEVE